MGISWEDVEKPGDPSVITVNCPDKTGLGCDLCREALPKEILNVYVTRYQSGGQFWPIMHNTKIFSLVLTQVIAIGVFGLKESTVAASLTVPLIIFTLLFNEYCRQRFHSVFKDNAAQGKYLVIGNVGDSRVVLGMRDKDDSLVAVQLTVDLKPILQGYHADSRVEAVRARNWL